MKQQIAAHILMVRPAHFQFNEETAASNAFQATDGKGGEEAVGKKAIEEFDKAVEILRSKEIDVIVAEDTTQPVKPDAIFPNNWVSFHQDGKVITYPMLTQNRRLERREDIIDGLRDRFLITERVHLERFENENIILEGTGSLVLDRVYRIAYACLSPRTSEALLDWFCTKAGYQKVAFTAKDVSGKEIYHTNVMMALGETFVIICMKSITSDDEKQMLLEKFKNTDKEVIEISLEQMNAFSGNMLQVRSKKGQNYLILSEQAYESLTAEQIELINKHTEILAVPIYTIEKYGGGSVRCMMAEVFLPEK